MSIQSRANLNVYLFPDHRRPDGEVVQYGDLLNNVVFSDFKILLCKHIAETRAPKAEFDKFTEMSCPFHMTGQGLDHQWLDLDLGSLNPLQAVTFEKHHDVSIFLGVNPYLVRRILNSTPRLRFFVPTMIFVPALYLGRIGLAISWQELSVYAMTTNCERIAFAFHNRHQQEESGVDAGAVSLVKNIILGEPEPFREFILQIA